MDNIDQRLQNRHGKMLDPETGDEMLVDTGSAAFRDDYQKQVAFQDKLRNDELKRARVDVIQVTVGESFVDPLVGYFRKKNGRRS